MKLLTTKSHDLSSQRSALLKSLFKKVSDFLDPKMKGLRDITVIRKISVAESLRICEIVHHV